MSEAYPSAIAVLPSELLRNKIQSFRPEQDRSRPHWPVAHMPLIISFLPPSQLSQAVKEVEALFEKTGLLDPWEITLSQADYFVDKDSASVYLKPNEYSEIRLKRIREALDDVLNTQNTKQTEFHPRLVVGQTPHEAVSRLQEKVEILLPMSWTFDCLAVISKNDEHSRGSRKRQSTNLTSSDTKGSKLRPSHDVFNRLLWDGQYSADEYIIGYEDRFLGVREIPLTSWKRELEDEEFIPFHRVVYFREQGDEGKVVWDRRSKLDLVFGSGQKD